MDPERLREWLIDEQDEADAGDGVHAVAAFRLLQVAAIQMRRAMDEQLAPAGLTTQQAMLLTLVRRLGQPTVTEVARAMHVSHQNVRQLVKALQDKDMLRPVADPADRRVTRLEATSSQAAFWRARNKADFAFVATLFDALPPGDQRQLVLLLGKLVRRGRDAEERRPRSG